jgi:hypothetical protein
MDAQPGIYRPEFPMDGNFTMVPNALIRNDELPPMAKMLLIYLLSHKIGYQILDDQIMRESGLGRAALRTSRKQLEGFGFIQLVRVRHTDMSWGGYRYELQDAKGWFATVAPSTVDTSIVAPSTVANPPDNRKLIPNKTNVKKNKLENTSGSPFNQFWTIYPKKYDKPLAIRSFDKALKRETIETILAGATRYRDDPNREHKYTKNPSSWLNADAWENPPEPAPAVKGRKLTNAEEGALLAQRERGLEQAALEQGDTVAGKQLEADVANMFRSI